MERMQDDDFVARSLSLWARARWPHWDEGRSERDGRCSERMEGKITANF